MNARNPYRAAGTFDGEAYIERQADQQLREAIEFNQRFPYMLAARQSGKSSLLQRIRSGQLLVGGDACRFAFCDFSVFGPKDLAEYDLFLDRFFQTLADSLEVKCPPTTSQPRKALLELLFDFPEQRLVLLLDEVDALRDCQFKDSFFSAVRSVFNERSSREELSRIQFVLAGAAQIEELITDEARSPFNVGVPIQLDDLSADEVTRMTSFMDVAGSHVTSNLPEWIYSYTHGSVYLTQLLLEQLFNWRVANLKATASDLRRALDDLVEVLVKEAASNVHFRNIHNIVCRDSTLVDAWIAWRRGHRVSNADKSRLCASGLSSKENPVRCLLYERVFGSEGVLRLQPAHVHREEVGFVGDVTGERIKRSHQGTAYDAFLSYNSQDQAIVESVAAELAARQCRCFVDRWYLQPGRDWVEALETALSSSRSVAMFIGPHEMGRWQQRERAWAFDRLAGSGDFSVIPVLLPGCEPPLGIMKQLLWIDLRDNPADPVQLDALAAAIRGQSESAVGNVEPTANICPYRGLLPFREEDADFFFGRDVYQQRLISLVQRQPVVAVVGAAGSGKSSLVSAGLFAALRRDSSGPVWEIARMVPELDPVHSLAEAIVPLIDPGLSGRDLTLKLAEVANALAHSEMRLGDLVNGVLLQQPGTQRLLLFVDQWEELYTNCEDDSRRDRFIQELLEATSRKDSPFSVVLSVRSDYYQEILQHRPLLDRIESGRLDLGPMNREELRSAIIEPGKQVDLRFQDGLVERVLNDAGDEPGRLALLEFVLAELWNQRSRDGQLTHEAYERLGGLSGAITQRAEGVFQNLNSTEQVAAESLFRRLVIAGDTTEEDRRRRANLQDLDTMSQQVARRLADARLLVTTRIEAAALADENDASGNETVEVAHEVLFRRWDRLKTWVDADRQFLLWRSRLASLRREFERDPKYAVLRGHALRESRLYVPSRVDELEEGERRFVLTSQAADRRRRLIARFATVTLLCGILLSGYLIARNNREREVRSLVETMLGTPSNTVSYYLNELQSFPDLATEELRAEFDNKDRERIQRVHAVYGLISFAAADSRHLTYLLDSIPVLPKDEGENLITALSALRDQDEKELSFELQNRIQQASEEEDKKNRYLAVAVGLGFTNLLIPECGLQTNVYEPDRRTSFVHGFRAFPCNLNHVAHVLANRDLDPDVRSALCVAVGLIGEDASDATHDVLRQLHDEAPDAGTHCASRWALLQQGVTSEEVDELPGKKPKSDRRDWYIIRDLRITMVRIPGRRFALGDVTDKRNPTEKDKSANFPALWMSDREINVAQFESLMPKSKRDEVNDVDAEHNDEMNPVGTITWLKAVEFCNRLSDKHSLPHFYQLIVSEGEDGHSKVPEVSIINPNGRGYRLPTEAEWEYACRAMSARDYCYGDTESLLPEYAVFAKWRSDVCGRRIPNAWGLFDMHGNLWEWCWEHDPSAPLGSHVMRGGSFFNFGPHDQMSANRGYGVLVPEKWFGFRVCRNPE